MKRKLLTASGLLALSVFLLMGQTQPVRPHHRVSHVLTPQGDNDWSALPSQIIPGATQVYRNGLALADGVDYGYDVPNRKLWFLKTTSADDVILVTYDTHDMTDTPDWD